MLRTSGPLKKLLPYLYEGIRIAGIMSTGDILAQTVVDERQLSEIDVERTFKFGCVGLLVVGPALRVWYAKINKWISPCQKPFVRGLKKMAIDQIIFAPFFTALVITSLFILRRESFEQIQQRLHSDYPEIMLQNYKFWPAVQLFNFSVVPFRHQVLFTQIFAVFWNCYLSRVLNRKN